MIKQNIIYIWAVRVTDVCFHRDWRKTLHNERLPVTLPMKHNIIGWQPMRDGVKVNETVADQWEASIFHGTHEPGEEAQIKLQPFPVDDDSLYELHALLFRGRSLQIPSRIEQHKHTFYFGFVWVAEMWDPGARTPRKWKKKGEIPEKCSLFGRVWPCRPLFVQKRNLFRRSFSDNKQVWTLCQVLLLSTHSDSPVQSTLSYCRIKLYN